MSANPAAVVDALLSAALAAPSLTGIAVADGPRLTNDSATPRRDRLFVGATDDGSGLAAEGENSPGQGVAGIIDVPTFSVACVIEVWSGSTTPSARRARAFEILDAVRVLLRPDSAGVTLGLRALSSAFVGSWQLSQVQSIDGFYVSLTFRVECAAQPSTN